MNRKSTDARWRTSGSVGPVLLDVGTSTVTGVRTGALPSELAIAEPEGLSHPVLCTLPLEPAHVRALGSDFNRAGLVFEHPAVVNDSFVDPYGVRWLWSEGQTAPLNHPLENATSLADVARHPFPIWPVTQQRPSESGLVILDAPCPGLLETCFALRNGWRFMEDLTDHWRFANALLDWAVEAVVQAYEGALQGLGRDPDLILYGDDLGFSGGMFLSVIDFRQFIRPRLQTVMGRIRRLCPAPVVFHSCGAIRPVLGDLAALGFDALNLDPVAREMVMPQVRRELPSELVLHGPIDLVALGIAIERRDMKSVAILTEELAQCAPSIAAPIDNLSTASEVLACRRAAAFVKAIDADDWNRLRRFGPVRSILDNALRATEADVPEVEPLPLAG